ncbi:MAG: NTP transferase domain-containing protein [Candidatus Thermoplasmatota archaeon]|nr:NTP transferase domain-containing protein [Candidatus Thermoplasmatota archaeon]
MKALVLAAGQGVRMGPLTENMPKPMLPVAGRPFLEHTILALKEAGIKEVCILTGYQGNTIKDHFKDGEALGVRISYLVQPKMLGTAHAVSMAIGYMDQPFLCMNGDVVVTTGLLEGMISKFEETGNTVMTLIGVQDASRFGLVTIKGDTVKDIVEKSGVPVKGPINAGTYLFKPNIFNAIEKTPISPRGEYEITNSIKVLMEKETVSAFVSDEKWIDIGSPWDLLNAHEIFMDRIVTDIQGEVQENVHIHGELILKKGAVIRSGTYLEGNVVIDEGAVIGPNSYIRGSTYIGKGSRVGAASEVKNSIIMDKTHIPHHNYVGDSIIGSRCNLGSGTKVANLRLDDGMVPVTLKGKRYDTGRRKLGVIMGDDVKTGINSTLDVGTIIFSGTRIGPGAHAAGTIGKNSRVH